MSTIFLTWELGGGIGHLLRLRPLAASLAARGHAVYAAFRDLSQINDLYLHAAPAVRLLPAPCIPPSATRPFKNAVSYAHLLADIGFHDKHALSALFHTWNTLFDLINPDLVIADHSPSALLALYQRHATGKRSIPTVNVGIGFFAPPNRSPMPHWLPNATPEQLAILQRDEKALLQKVNRLLETQKRPPLPALASIFHDNVQTLLATYKEFDHFVDMRPPARYWGHWPYASPASTNEGEAPALLWPSGTGPKIYAYLKPFPALEPFLQYLRDLRHPTLMYAQGIDTTLLQKYASPTLRFELRPLDLQQVARTCDVAILNANHGTAAALLLAGKPLLLLPLFTEQLLFAQRVEQTGAGKIAPVDNADALTSSFKELLDKLGQYEASAKTFAMRYANFAPGSQLPEVMTYLESQIRT